MLLVISPEGWAGKHRVGPDAMPSPPSDDISPEAFVAFCAQPEIMRWMINHVHLWQIRGYTWQNNHLIINWEKFTEYLPLGGHRDARDCDDPFLMACFYTSHCPPNWKHAVFPTDPDWVDGTWYQLRHRIYYERVPFKSLGFGHPLHGQRPKRGATPWYTPSA